MKRYLGTLIRSPWLQQFALKSSVYPRFLQWCKLHPCEVVIGTGNQARERLYQRISARFDLGDTPIAYWEFGVHRGRSIEWWVNHNGHVNSTFIGFDSFLGLPEDWNSQSRVGTFSTQGSIPNISDTRCAFVRGWFHETLPGWIEQLVPSQRKVVHLDADLYRSTILVLLYLAPKLKAGDVLIFDEFQDSAHEYRAFEDYEAIFKPSYEVIACTSGYSQIALILR